MGKEMEMSKQQTSSHLLLDIAFMILGSLMSAFALNQFIIPSGLLSGGVTGISQILNHFVLLNVGILYFVFNIPLLWIGHKHLGKKFSIYTIVSTALLSFFLYFIPVQFVWTENILLCAIFGGLINSLGSGLVLRRGGSQGGLDILSRVIAKYKNVTVGKVGLLINLVIILISGVIFGSEIALYTVISIFVGMKTYEVILNHVDRVSVLIVTEKGEEVCEAVTSLMHRGITTWNASGGFTHKEKTALFCVIMNGELSQLKQIVKSVDQESFVTIISTQSVMGRFHQIW